MTSEASLGTGSRLNASLGRLFTSALGRPAERGEPLKIDDNLEFRIIRADSRKVRLLNICVLPPDADPAAVGQH